MFEARAKTLKWLGIRPSQAGSVAKREPERRKSEGLMGITELAKTDPVFDTESVPRKLIRFVTHSGAAGQRVDSATSAGHQPDLL